MVSPEDTVKMLFSSIVVILQSTLLQCNTSSTLPTHDENVSDEKKN